MTLIEISQDFLKAAKTGEDTFIHIKMLRDTPLNHLLTTLDNDDKKKAFWINTYNAFATTLLKPNPPIILNSFSRKVFFNKKQIEIGACIFSLNDIEHSILRKSSIWWSKGYLKKWFVSARNKKLRVETLDSRIHFALNCGGLGCPPIRFYDSKTLNEQLEIATHAFLFSEVKEDQTKNMVKISMLFNWYLGDFGGKSGLIRLFKKYQVLTKESINPTIKFTAYNWQPWIK